MRWQDLSTRENHFTVRSAAMIDLAKNKTIRIYSANTKIAVVQKCVTKEGTFYRTETAKEKGLDWAFKASAFGLPNEKAPSAPKAPPLKTPKPAKPRTRKPATKQKPAKKELPPEDGEAKPQETRWYKKLFRRKNG